MSLRRVSVLAVLMLSLGSAVAFADPNSLLPQAIEQNTEEQLLPTAVRQNDLVGVAELLQQGNDVNKKDPLGYTPLMIAAGLGNPQMVELLLTAGADVFVMDSRMGASTLHKAAQSGVVDVARLLIQRGAFVDLQAPTHGHTPLLDAVWHKKAGMVKYLLQQGANMNIRAHAGYTAMDVAKRDNLQEIVRILEEGKKVVAQKAQQQQLMVAVKNNDVATVKRLIQAGVDVNEKSPIVGGPDDGHTPLLVAARDGNQEIVQALLDAGANPRIVDWLMKATPGHKAGYMGHTRIAQMLLEHGLEVDAQGPYNGYTALHDAIWHGHTETAKLFINASARLDLKGHDGNTPLDLARQYGYSDIMALIEAKQGSP